VAFTDGFTNVICVRHMEVEIYLLKIKQLSSNFITQDLTAIANQLINVLI